MFLYLKTSVYVYYNNLSTCKVVRVRLWVDGENMES